jgi:hypothetical protein
MRSDPATEVGEVARGAQAEYLVSGDGPATASEI